jgi:hypothetical protein
MGFIAHTVTTHKNPNGSIPGPPDEKLQEHHYRKLGAQCSFHICRLNYFFRNCPPSLFGCHIRQLADTAARLAPPLKLQRHANCGRLDFALKLLFPLISNTLKIDEYLLVPKFENYNKNALARVFCANLIYILNYGQYL